MACCCLIRFQVKQENKLPSKAFTQHCNKATATAAGPSSIWCKLHSLEQPPSTLLGLPPCFQTPSEMTCCAKRLFCLSKTSEKQQTGKPCFAQALKSVRTQEYYTVLSLSFNPEKGYSTRQERKCYSNTESPAGRKFTEKLHLVEKMEGIGRKGTTEKTNHARTTAEIVRSSP